MGGGPFVYFCRDVCVEMYLFVCVVRVGFVVGVAHLRSPNTYHFLQRIIENGSTLFVHVSPILSHSFN